jgi:hypothetical protein
MYGHGESPYATVNRWDYVRYGRLTTGEVVVASDPPSGVVNANAYPNLDRFTVTFDQPGYVYIDDVAVDVIATKPRSHEATEGNVEEGSKATRQRGNKGNVETSKSPNVQIDSFDLQHSTFDIPVVVATRRQDNGPPETVEIVLDRPLALGVTTRFTFNTGAAEPQVVEYTLVQLEPCCLPGGACAELTSQDCTAQGGAPPTSEPRSSDRADLRNSMTSADADSPRGMNSAARLGTNACEGDADADGVDGLCGDECPADSGKLAPGQCGCGVPDNDTDSDGVANCLDQCPGSPDIDSDSDGVLDCLDQCPGAPDIDSDSDTVLDCLDQCPGTDDRLDANANGTPDCLESTEIPAVSSWGVAVVSLVLLILAKLRFAPRLSANS